MHLEIASTITMWLSLSIVIIAVILYMSERISIELISAGIVTGLIVLFSLPFAVDDSGKSVPPDILLAGFGNGALITIMALLIIGQAMFQTGALDGPSRRLVSLYDSYPRMTLAITFSCVFLTSAFINNTPVVVMFLPIIGAFATKMGSFPSRLMMPLSFVSVLAGMTTLIGSSTNLLAAESLERLTDVKLGFFDLSPIGLCLAAVGLVYIIVFSPLLLPRREATGELNTEHSGKQFIAQIEITPNHPLLDHQAVAGMFPELPNITVRLIQRGHETFLPPFDDVALQKGDLIIVAATRKALTEALSRRPKLLQSIWLSSYASPSEEGAKPPTLSLTEAVVAPGSRLISRTIDQIGYARLQDAVVLGVQRRSRMIRARLGEIRLEAGDTLLLCGTTEGFEHMRSDRDLLLLDWSRTDLPDRGRAIYARFIAAGVVITAATGILDILVASLIGAVGMIAFGCLNPRQAARALDLRIYLLIGAALAMGASLEVTGAAEFIANQAITIASPFGPLAVLSMLFVTVAIVTNVLSNSATAVIFTPIAIASAKQLGLDPVPFVMAVIYGSNCAFATPIAYQTNLLVMGPGHYRFVDFVKFGLPLVLLIWITFTVVVGWHFDLA